MSKPKTSKCCTFELVRFPKVRIPLHAKKITTLELAKLTFLDSDEHSQSCSRDEASADGMGWYRAGSIVANREAMK